MGHRPSARPAPPRRPEPEAARRLAPVPRARAKAPTDVPFTPPIARVARPGSSPSSLLVHHLDMTRRASIGCRLLARRLPRPLRRAVRGPPPPARPACRWSRKPKVPAPPAPARAPVLTVVVVARDTGTHLDRCLRRPPGGGPLRQLEVDHHRRPVHRPDGRGGAGGGGRGRRVRLVEHRHAGLAAAGDAGAGWTAGNPRPFWIPSSRSRRPRTPA